MPYFYILPGPRDGHCYAGVKYLGQRLHDRVAAFGSNKLERHWPEAQTPALNG